jgi:predicted nucleic acid-binding Zn ribbon protein
MKAELARFKECVMCGKDYRGVVSTSAFCSKECREKYERASNVEFKERVLDKDA